MVILNLMAAKKPSKDANRAIFEEAPIGFLSNAFHACLRRCALHLVQPACAWNPEKPGYAEIADLHSHPAGKPSAKRGRQPGLQGSYRAVVRLGSGERPGGGDSL